MKNFICFALILFVFSSCTVNKQNIYRLEYENVSESLADSSLVIIEKRLSFAKMKRIKYKKEDGEVVINFSSKKQCDNKQIESLFTTIGKLEFLETYFLPEIIDSLISINKLLSKDDFIGKNSINIDDDGLSEFANEYPLFYFMRPNYNRASQPIKSAEIGFCRATDTIFVNRILRNSKYSQLLPLDFNYMYKPSYLINNTEYLTVVATRKNGLTGNMILSSKAVSNKYSSIDDIQIQFNNEYIEKWANFTKRNIGRSIAIVIDDVVYSLPIVNMQINGGRVVISSITENIDTYIQIISHPPLLVKFKVSVLK